MTGLLLLTLLGAPDFIWQKQSPTSVPTARSDAGSFYDSDMQKVVLFGGSAQGVDYNDTWTWDGVRWDKLDVATTPPTRVHFMLAYDQADNNAILFGGGYRNQQRTVVLDETWLFENGDWEQLQTNQQTPPGRTYGASAYDGNNRSVIIFGGLGIGGALNDTWLWEGMGWLQMPQGGAPSPRLGAAMIWDPQREEVVLFGGASATTFEEYSDTWIWDGSVWKRINDNGPAPRANAAMAFDEALGVVLLFGGEYSLPTGSSYVAREHRDLWAWNGSSWSQLSDGSNNDTNDGSNSGSNNGSKDFPSFRTRATLVYHPDSEHTLLFGGADGDGPKADTWALYLPRTPLSCEAGLGGSMWLLLLLAAALRRQRLVS